MRIFLFLLVSSFYSCYLWAENENNQSAKHQENCETHRVINETSGFVHTITRCIHKTSPNESTVKQNAQSNYQSNSDSGTNSLNKQDLVAQQSMAKSTHWIMLISLGGLIIGGFGLFYLKKTVGHSQEASNYALQTLNVAKDEYRCDMVVVDRPTHLRNPDNFPAKINFGFGFANYGKTNAFKCSYSWGFTEFTGNHEIISNFDAGQGSIGEGKVQPNRPTILIDGFLFEFETPKDYAKRIVIRLQGFDKFDEPFCIDFSARAFRESEGRYCARVAAVADKHTYSAGIDTPDEVVRKVEEREKRKRC